MHTFATIFAILVILLLIAIYIYPKFKENLIPEPAYMELYRGYNGLNTVSYRPTYSFINAVEHAKISDIEVEH